MNNVESPQPIISDRGELTQSSKQFSGDTVLVGVDDTKEESDLQGEFYMNSQRRSSLGSNGTPNSHHSSGKAIDVSANNGPRENTSTYSKCFNTSNPSSPATTTPSHGSIQTLVHLG